MGMPKLNSDNYLGDGIYGNVIANYPGDYENVIHNKTFRPALEGLGSDIANIEYYIENPGNDWQTALWKQWIDYGFKRVLQEITMKSWVYGQCYTLPTLNVFWYKGKRYIYPEWLIPLDMSRVTIKNDRIVYGTKEYKKDDLMKSVFFTWSGEVFAMGSLFSDTVDYMNNLEKAWATATCANSVGMLLFMRDKESSPVNEPTSENLAILKNAHGKTWGTSAEIPSSIRDVKMLTGASKYQEFRAGLEYFTSSLFTAIRSQYLLSSITTPGTYGTAKTLKQAAIEYVESLADLVTESINDLVATVAGWNNEMPTVKIANRGVSVSESDPDSDLKFLQAVQMIENMKDSLNKDTLDVLTDRLGLPDQTPDPVPETETPTANIDQIKRWIDHKVGQWLRLVQDKHDGGVQAIKLSGKSGLANMLNLNPQQASDFDGAWTLLQEELNSAAKSDEYENLFYEAIERFKNEVKQWL